MTFKVGDTHRIRYPKKYSTFLYILQSTSLAQSDLSGAPVEHMFHMFHKALCDTAIPSSTGRKAAYTLMLLAFWASTRAVMSTSVGEREVDKAKGWGNGQIGLGGGRSRNISAQCILQNIFYKNVLSRPDPPT